MPRLTTPGVFIEEVSSTSRAIAGASTAVTAFIGVTARGSVGEPKVVESMADYLALFAPTLLGDDVMALAVQAFFLNGGRRAFICSIPSGAESELRHYTQLFDKVLPDLAVNILVLPGQYWAEDGTGNAVISLALAHCERFKNRMLIIDPPETLALQNEAAVRRMALPSSDFAVFYYPWVGMKSPAFDKVVNVSPSAFAAGIWSKIDESRGVWKTPAGLPLIGASSLAFNVTRFAQQQLNPLGVNCIRQFPRRGMMLWGGRTLSSSNSDWRFISVRRLAIFIEDSINKSIEWVVFEPNDEPLWLSLRQRIDAFMLGLYRDGALQGRKPDDAFFVRVGLGDTMTQADINQGLLNVHIGFAPLKPAEFVMLDITKKLAIE